ncbi:SulP family inorganic anion transporter [Pedobacter sp. SYSU D00535]|uniref:SulP family inorganic anion transporter n=1 Tax=Pedobacter sp. SYSU D00535 TaxID=2810308 RepID=UPI001F610733|nr:SulP family inorganic anion transporter [Pedobacter sp. SYSU D00535]
MAANRMSASTNPRNLFSAQNLKKDLPASIVVFLVALPLCLGIALASGAPLFAGILTGIIGGIVTASFSGSQLSVSGPAAGLTVIVLGAISQLGSYETFILAVFLAGIMQIVLGMIKAGTIANYFPSAVIEGMLAAIGIILILKQIPHAVGYDADYEGDESFKSGNNENTFTAIATAFSRLSYGAVIISALSILVLIYWPKVKKLAGVPAALVVVVIGVVLNYVFKGSELEIQADHLVTVPVVGSTEEFFNLFITPDFSQIMRSDVWIVAGTLAIVASLETLLSVEAVDKIDPLKRVSPTNRELFAQGIGNMTSGLLGGLPMTAVIVRSSANVNSGARTKLSAIFHGIWLTLSLLLIPGVINSIPLACLAAILLMTGYKLARIALFQKMWREGKDQFIPFVVTVLAVVFTDLLKGVGIGMAVGIFYILRNNLRNPYFYTIGRNGDKKVIHIKLAEEVSFLNKAAIQYTLNHLPDESDVVIDGTNSRYIDSDVLEIIHNFKHNAYSRGIIVQLVNIKHKYDVPQLKDLIFKPEKIRETEAAPANN